MEQIYYVLENSAKSNYFVPVVLTLFLPPIMWGIYRKFGKRSLEWKILKFGPALICMAWVLMYFVNVNSLKDRERLQQLINTQNYKTISGVVRENVPLGTAQLKIIFESGEVFFSRDVWHNPYGCTPVRNISIPEFAENGNVVIATGDYIEIDYTNRIFDKVMPEGEPCILRIWASKNKKQ